MAGANITFANTTVAMGCILSDIYGMWVLLRNLCVLAGKRWHVRTGARGMDSARCMARAVTAVLGTATSETLSMQANFLLQSEMLRLNILWGTCARMVHRLGRSLAHSLIVSTVQITRHFAVL